MVRPEQAHAGARIIRLWQDAPDQIAQVGCLSLRREGETGNGISDETLQMNTFRLLLLDLLLEGNPHVACNSCRRIPINFGGRKGEQ